MKKITFLLVALCATVFANAADFDMAEAEFVYFASYSSEDGQNFYTSLYSDMTWGEDAETGYSVPTSEGNYMYLDAYAATTTSFVGTYTFDADDTYAAGTFSAGYSGWVNVDASGVETDLALTAGTVTITNNGAGYTVVYSVTDENSTVHTGTYAFDSSVFGIYDEDGNDYSATIVDDATAISHVEASLEVYTRNGNIVVPAEAGQRVEVYNMMGQTVYNGIAQSGETVIAGLSTQQVLVVRAGNKTAKVIL